MLMMTMYDDLNDYFCWNEKCPKHDVRGEGNIRIRDVYGRNNTRLLYCLACKRCFSERRGTVFFGSRLPEMKIIDVIEHLAGGCGIRETGRSVEVHRSTVSRLKKLMIKSNCCTMKSWTMTDGAEGNITQICICVMFGKLYNRQIPTERKAKDK
jgi:hypothetical protein